MTARARLAILYAALVLAAGILLTALTYLLMRRTGGHRISVITLSPPPDPDAMPLPPQSVKAVTLTDFVTQATIALVVVTALAAVLGWAVAGRVLRPIRVISATAQRLSAENLSERMPLTTPADELATLAATVNGMLDRIQQGITERDQVLASQRAFTANAAHELRTPLTTMRTAIDVTLDSHPDADELLAMTGDVRTAVRQNQRTLDGLLALAHSQAGIRLRHHVDLAEIMTNSLDGVNPTVQTDLRPAPVSGEPVLLERMCHNLVDNAVRHNRPGGHIEVTTGSADGQAFLRIGNSGPPIPPETVDRLREPFVRGDGARLHTNRGTGLGLSIVDAVVTAHQGTLTITARPAGGLDVAVHLPSAGHLE
ncbi:HAMP domain-containing sensor histidine kinase [Umezawaea sp. Da 62-37]|uniref:sensor histidine kinase n=1 Tax=Umezawaea sp. Da 62-37 TaxID=3075927 RepID=UPI0028F6DFF2|nr:HAMP domain-containing sensor histidine kinase [Umezawaea sp. Da 62-37]WNV87842.1 HAMP domain-containing sensor histidine kinase [Umezawaea sp. Da 62-37]